MNQPPKQPLDQPVDPALNRNRDPAVHSLVQCWLNDVVAGLGLCPFAARPLREGRVRITVSEACTEEQLALDLNREIARLDTTEVGALETTLVVITEMLRDFDAYNQFLDVVDDLLVQQGWEGTFQVASFHPDYRFAGTEPNALENLTNRSPYPILHILREASVEAAVAQHPDTAAITERNIETLQGMSEIELGRRFPWLSAVQPAEAPANGPDRDG